MRNYKYFDDPKYPEELNIRKWEHSLGFSYKIFYDMIFNLNSKTILEGEEITLKKLEKIFNNSLKNFNRDSLNLFQNKIFKTKNKVDIKFVKFMLFLLCPSDFMRDNKILDKVEFIHNLLNDYDSNEVSRDILELTLDPIFTLACDVMPLCYKNSKEIFGGSLLKEELYLLKLKEKCQQIKTVYFDLIFDKRENISIFEFNEIIVENPLVKVNFNFSYSLLGLYEI